MIDRKEIFQIAICSIIFSGCGGTRRTKVATPADTSSSASSNLEESGSSTESNCTKKDCPDAVMGINPSGLSEAAGVLVGFVDEDVDWSFEGIDQEYTGRSIGVFIEDAPSSSETDKAEVDESIKISWVPKQAEVSDKPIVVITRDLERCKIEAKKSSNCTVKKYMSKFDIKTKMNYEIVDRSELDQAANTALEKAADCKKDSERNGLITAGVSAVAPSLGGIVGILGGMMGGGGC